MNERTKTAMEKTAARRKEHTSTVRRGRSVRLDIVPEGNHFAIDGIELFFGDSADYYANGFPDRHYLGWGLRGTRI